MNLVHTLKSLFRGMPKLVTGGTPSERAGDRRLARYRLDTAGAAELKVMSPAFTFNGQIPKKYTQDGLNQSPPLRWGGLPEGTQSLALVVEDPDAPTPEPFVHWMIAELDPSVEGLPDGIQAEGNDAVMQGINSTLKVGYVGCAPPKGDVAHRYHFQLFALNKKVGLTRNFGRDELFRAVRGHVLGFGETVGIYARPV
ncbi:MAG: YbhB/YbcL family Raf kinase inhibitor-like protein [Myxococcaceae bacterium]